MKSVLIALVLVLGCGVAVEASHVRQRVVVRQPVFRPRSVRRRYSQGAGYLGKSPPDKSSVSCAAIFLSVTHLDAAVSPSSPS